MSRSRRMPPLFEVMRETNPARTPITPVPVTAPPPPTRVTTTPQAAPTPVIRSIAAPPPPSTAAAAPTREASGPAPLSLRPAPAELADEDEVPAAPVAGPGPRFDLNRTVAVPVKAILIAASVGIALLILVWLVAWKGGASDARKEWVGGIPEPDPTQVVTPNTPQPTRDPLGNTASAPPIQRPQTQQQQAATNRPSNTTTQPPQAPVTPPAAPAGQITDPRGTGLNFLTVETVKNYADAEAIVAYLDANGLKAVAIPKGTADIAAAKAAGQKDWEVVLLEGIPGNQYSAKAARRAELITQVQRLGDRLGREGLSNYRLASPGWKKY